MPWRFNPFTVSFDLVNSFNSVNSKSPNFSYKKVNEEITIPAGQQMIVYGRIKVQERLVIKGSLALLSSTAGSTTPAGITFRDKNEIADAQIVVNRIVTLDATPLVNSISLFVNGIYQKDGYNISGLDITLDVALDIKLGDLIDIKYAS